MSLRVRLYSKPGCHLCDEALAELNKLRAWHPHALDVVDISRDPQLMHIYGERIPVLEVGGREYAAPLSRTLLERALEEVHAS
jgi:hypothetical protein